MQAEKEKRPFVGAAFASVKSNTIKLTAPRAPGVRVDSYERGARSDSSPL
jgi:hypothetical protein